MILSIESTFAHALNSIGTPTLVVEMGVGMRVTRAYGEQLTDGIFQLMRSLGIWKDTEKDAGDQDTKLVIEICSGKCV